LGRKLERPLTRNPHIRSATSRRPGGIHLSNIPEGLRYTNDHEWAKLEGRGARIGITDHAQSELTDVVYVELPKAGKVVKRGEPLGVVESVKAVSEIFAPLSGTIVEVNRSLEDHPEKVNKDPYGEGWMALLELSNPAEAESLLDAAAYRRHIGEA
jgi:glycine cleavage system H protein